MLYKFKLYFWPTKFNAICQHVLLCLFKLGFNNLVQFISMPTSYNLLTKRWFGLTSAGANRAFEEKQFLKLYKFMYKK